MATKLISKAEQWLKRIDKPRQTGHYLAVDRQAVERMIDAAVSVEESYGSYIYIFEDGSSLWEKHTDDWFPGVKYIQCPECDEWRKFDAAYTSDICAECDDGRKNDTNVSDMKFFRTRGTTSGIKKAKR